MSNIMVVSGRCGFIIGQTPAAGQVYSMGEARQLYHEAP
jgi:hypothetical protein